MGKKRIVIEENCEWAWGGQDELDRTKWSTFDMIACWIRGSEKTYEIQFVVCANSPLSKRSTRKKKLNFSRDMKAWKFSFIEQKMFYLFSEFWDNREVSFVIILFAHDDDDAKKLSVDLVQWVMSSECWLGETIWGGRSEKRKTRKIYVDDKSAAGWLLSTVISGVDGWRNRVTNLQEPSNSTKMKLFAIFTFFATVLSEIYVLSTSNVELMAKHATQAASDFSAQKWAIMNANDDISESCRSLNSIWLNWDGQRSRWRVEKKNIL